MSRILVTGANGFVGSALCAALESRGIPFTGCVRKSDDKRAFEIGDLNATTDWTGALAGCDAVIHLAARVHVMKDRAVDPMGAYREVNVDATMNLARQAAAHGIRRFVFVSSVKVNGETTSGKPFTASDMPAPVDPYGRSKWEAECALHTLSEQTGMEVAVVRPPLVYGLGVRANFLKLMQLVKAGFPLPFGWVGNRRSMVALDNLVDFLILCASHPQAAGRTFLISDGEDLSLADLIRLIASAMDKRPVLLPVPTRMMTWGARLLGQSGIADRLLGSLQVDIGDARQRLGWRPVIEPGAAVRQAVSHFLRQTA